MLSKETKKEVKKVRKAAKKIVKDALTHDIVALNEKLREHVKATYSSQQMGAEESVQETPKSKPCPGLVFKASTSSYANTQGHCTHRETLRIQPKLACSCEQCATLLVKFYDEISRSIYPVYERPLIDGHLYKLIGVGEAHLNFAKL
jgi:hypothetical protein